MPNPSRGFPVALRIKSTMLAAAHRALLCPALSTPHEQVLLLVPGPQRRGRSLETPSPSTVCHGALASLLPRNELSVNGSRLGLFSVFLVSLLDWSSGCIHAGSFCPVSSIKLRLAHRKCPGNVCLQGVVRRSGLSAQGHGGSQGLTPRWGPAETDAPRVLRRPSWLLPFIPPCPHSCLPASGLTLTSTTARHQACSGKGELVTRPRTGLLSRSTTSCCLTADRFLHLPEPQSPHP